MREIRHLNNDEFQRLVDSKINISSQFSDDLDGVASKIYSDVDEKLTDKDDSVFHDYKGKLTVNELYQLARKIFIHESKRITIEMFPGFVTDNERVYIIDRSVSLTDKNYEIVSIEDLVRMKFTEDI